MAHRVRAVDFKGRCQILEGHRDEVEGAGAGHMDSGWMPSEGVGNARSEGRLGEHSIRAVVLRRWAEVPAVNAVGSVRTAHVRVLKDDHLCPNRCDGMSVEVVRVAVETLIRR